jgi:type II secretory ATPase GspE/PulE/Tfp pilus assembly ATPase PilB-like protein
MKSMRKSSLSKLEEGVTTLEEVLRVTMSDN